jgi:hypothetical protein
MAKFFLWQTMVRRGLYFYTASILILYLTPSFSFAAPPGTGSHRDSVLPVRIIFNLNSGNSQVDAQLTDIETEYRVTLDNRKAFSRLRRLTGLHVPFWSSRLRSRLFDDLAGVTAKLKWYAIAMKCYYSEQHDPDLPDPARASLGEDDLPDSVLPSTVLSTGAHDSPPVNIGDILASFNDGKTASSYALLVEVKQPVPGKRKSFTDINNVGHMFITLIKYNRDNSCVYRSFGFYPRKSNLLSATPLHPSSPSVLKDDAGHDWDEIAGKFISAKRFERIIAALQSYDHQTYHLNRNNCTDFGLVMARIGGIDILNTVGRWPLGKGNNPANAGQSMLEQRLINTDGEFSDPLFVSNNIPPSNR